MSHFVTFINASDGCAQRESAPVGFPLRAHLSILVLVLVLTTHPLGEVVWGTVEASPGPQSLMGSSNVTVDPEDANEGFTVIAPYFGNKVYLVDRDGTTVHTWQSTRYTTGTVVLLDDGTLLRGRSSGTGQSYGIHILDWDGTVLWDWQPPSPYQIHHDIVPLPNGNLLVNAMYAINKTTAINLGRDPANPSTMLSIEPILEIEPNGTTGGDIVWSWDPLDHIVQEYDEEKPNYGVVEDHPELLDFNYPDYLGDEWTHSNSLAYNAEFDQIMVTDRNYDELWVIDHSTTTAEAEGHTGGTYGRGGDLLYRWGNPQAYDMGDAEDQILYGPHDAKWVAPDLPGAGKVIVFNNGKNMLMARPEGNFSSVEEFDPPMNATGWYQRSSGKAFGPSVSAWRYTADPPDSFWAITMGGVERLPNGNTLVCGGSTGKVMEVTSTGVTVWSYKTNPIFQAHRYYPPALEPLPSLVAMEDVMRRIDLSNYIRDLDTDHEDLEIKARSGYASVVGHELIIQYPNGVTSDVIDVAVTDGIFEAGRKVRVNVTPVNDPPVIEDIPEIPAIEDVTYRLDLRSYVSDVDNEFGTLNFTVDSPFVTVDLQQLRFLYPEGVLDDRVLLSVSDGKLEASTEITVKVTPVNDPPVVDFPSSLECIEDVPLVIDLEDHIQDVDTPIRRLSISSSSPYASISGGNLTLIYPEGVTKDRVTLTVRDGMVVTMATIDVTIEPVNDPPVLDDVPPLSVTEDVPFFLDLGHSISDPDTPLENLYFTVDSPFVEVAGRTLIFLYPDGILEDSVVVRLSDGVGTTIETLSVRVEPVNDPPKLKALAPVVLTEDELFTLDLDPAISDIDTPDGELILEVDSPYVQVDGLALHLLYPDGVLKDEVVVHLSDGEWDVSTTLSVSVGPVNDAPSWTGPFDVLAFEDKEGEVSLDAWVSDVDTPPGALEFEADSLYGTLKGHVFRYLYPEGVDWEVVTFTVSDGEFQATLLLNISVSPVNDPPRLSGASVTPAGDGGRYRCAVVFTDVDIGAGDPDVVVIIDGKESVCARDRADSGSYKDGVVFSVRVRLEPGSHTVIFSAHDDQGAVATTEVQRLTVDDPSGIWGSPIISTIVIAIAAVAVFLTARASLSRRRGSSGSG